MTPEFHARAVEIFEQAIAIENDAERRAWVQSTCADRPDLERRVLDMLAADRMPGLSRPAIHAAADLIAADLVADESVLGAELRGTRLGPYLVGDPIGAGGMGTVYEARDVRLGRKVALKVLPSRFVQDQERVQRFRQEARAVSLLNHPNIISIFDADLIENRYYIAMELVEGQTLRKLLASAPNGIDSQLLLDLLGQSASALGAAHAAGIVHRDIKPENIMLRPDGIVKILDFGLAKLTEADPDDPSLTQFRTQSGFFAGTIHYLSPEQAAGKPVDARSDLFSVGVVAYELATGVRPHHGPSDRAIYHSILDEVPPPPSSIRPGLPPELDSLILRAIEKDPDLRFQTAADLRSECKRIARDSSASRPIPMAARQTARKRAMPIAAAGVLAAVVIFASWMWLARRRVEPLTPIEFQRLTDAPGEETSPSPTPDGKQFIYASARDGNWDIFLQRTGGSTAVNLTRDFTADDTQPAVSRDGSRIVFRSERDGGGLFVMESTGENPRRLTHEGYLPAWSPDGRYVVYSNETFSVPSSRGPGDSRLSIVNTMDGSSRQLDTSDAVQPNWSPHGQRIAYWGLSEGGRRDIFTIAASGNAAPVAVTSDAAIDWNPVWSPSGSELYFLSNRGGTMNIWRVPIDEQSGRTLGAPEPVTVPAPYVGALSIAADGKSLIYSQSSQSHTLGRIGFDPLRRTTVGTPEPFDLGHTGSTPSFSPDGSQVVFDTVGDATEDVWIMNVDGSGRRRLTSNARRNITPVWSPNGEEIVFLSDRAGQYDLWLIQPDGSGLRPLTDKPSPYMQRGIWIQNGKYILASRDVGPLALLDPAAPAPVANPAAAAGTDGAKILIYLSSWTEGGGGIATGDLLNGPAAPEIALYSPATGKLESTGVQGRYAAWLRGNTGPQDRYFVFTRGSDCLLYDRTVKRESPLFSIAPNRFYSLTRTPDGARLYFTQTIRDGDLWLASLRR